MHKLYEQQTNGNKNLSSSTYESRKYPNILNSNSFLNNNNKHDQSHNQEVHRNIIHKIRQVDHNNKKLMDISNTLKNNSIHMYDLASQQQKMLPVIYEIQTEVKQSFNQLINSIQQFYIDIDGKLKDLCLYVATLSHAEGFETTKGEQEHIMSFSLSSKEQIKHISQKVQTLQKNLQQTQRNQKNLMGIIEKLMDKYQPQQEATIIRQEPILRKLQDIKFDKHTNNLQMKTEQSSFQQLYKNNHRNKMEGGMRNSKNNNHNHNKSYKVQDIHKHQYYNKTARAHQPLVKPSNKQYKSKNSSFIGFNNTKNINEAKTNNQPNPDYSIHQQLKMIESQAQSHSDKNRSTNPHRSPKPQYDYGTSSVSITSQVYSEPKDEQCFIRKLYSKPNQSLNKVSLKGKDPFQFKKKEKEDYFDQYNKNHRQEYMLKNLNK